MMLSVLYLTGEACTDFLKSLLLLIPMEAAFICIAHRHSFRISGRHIVGVSFFELLLLLIFIVTGIPSLKQILADGIRWWPDSLNLIPFAYISDGLFTYIANIILFVPFGFLCPLLWKSKRFWYKTVAAGFLLSLLIELSQLLNFRVTDVDDLLMNTLGTLAGFLCFALFRRTAPLLSSRYSLENGGGFPTSGLLRQELPLLVITAFASSFALLPYLTCY